MPGGISVGIGAGGLLPQPAPRPIALEVRKYDPNNPPKFPAVDPSRLSANQSPGGSLPSTGIDTSRFQKSSISQRPYIWKPYPQA
jgi:hypothetical protein